MRSVRLTRPLTALFAATLFLGSFLLFVVQPMFAKMALPLLGGSPAVWNTCVVFFQAALVAGYAYAHVLTTRVAGPRQAVVHGLVLGLALLTLPIAIPTGWTPPAESTPIPWLLLLLAVAVGPPFFVVSTTAPLLQKWFAGTAEPGARDPYFLYAASNAGSFLALLSYPFVVEPASTVMEQSRLWMAGYALFGALTAACAIAAWRSRAPAEVGDTRPAAGDDGLEVPTWKRRAHWIALAAVPSSMTLGVTTYLSTDIAAVPLLWTVPLAIYLASFVIAFGRTSGRIIAANRRAMPLLACVLALFMIGKVGGPLWLVIPVHLVAFFSCALMLHAELARTRPVTTHLTEFYFWLAVGGVVGGAFNALLAPWLFTGIVEYPLALVLAGLLQPRWPGHSPAVDKGDFLLPLAAGAAIVVSGLVLTATAQNVTTALAFWAPLVIWCFSFSRRPTRFGLGLAMLLLGSQTYRVQSGEPVFAERTFFGVHRVVHDPSQRRIRLVHGNILHGQQSLEPHRRGEPMAYYHRSGPIGQVFDSLSSRLAEARIGVIGLGSGGLSAYARPGQRWTFYEIDPAVERIARNANFFTYIQACGSVCTVSLGDARLSLARTKPRSLDLLILDAFSSDAIPVHLLSREALALYLDRLTPDGIVVFHISNRHLDLEPVLATLAAERGLEARVQYDRSRDADAGRLPSQWLVMGRSGHSLGPLADDPKWASPTSRELRAWTDSYTNLLDVLRPMR